MLLLIPVAVAPLWAYSAAWGWWPVAVILLAIAVLLLFWPSGRGAAHRTYPPAGTFGLLAVVLIVLLIVGIL